MTEMVPFPRARLLGKVCEVCAAATAATAVGVSKEGRKKEKLRLALESWDWDWKTGLWWTGNALADKNKTGGTTHLHPLPILQEKQPI